MSCMCPKNARECFWYVLVLVMKQTIEKFFSKKSFLVSFLSKNDYCCIFSEVSFGFSNRMKLFFTSFSLYFSNVLSCSFKN